MTGNEIRQKLSDIIYDTLDLQGYMPNPEQEEELRAIRYATIDLQNKMFDRLD